MLQDFPQTWAADVPKMDRYDIFDNVRGVVSMQKSTRATTAQTIEQVTCWVMVLSAMVKVKMCEAAPKMRRMTSAPPNISRPIAPNMTSPASAMLDTYNEFRKEDREAVAMMTVRT